MSNFKGMTTDRNYQGCYAEVLFSAECTKLGYIVSKPMLDSSPYDVIVDTGEGLFKVQVKFTSQLPTVRKNSIHISLSNSSVFYTIKAVDYFAIYSTYFGGFFIIPNSGNHQAFRLNPKGKYSDNFNKFVFK